jgi:hypothetical protein
MAIDKADQKSAKKGPGTCSHFIHNHYPKNDFAYNNNVKKKKT